MKPHTAETRDKIRASVTRRWADPEYRASRAVIAAAVGALSPKQRANYRRMRRRGWFTRWLRKRP